MKWLLIIIQLLFTTYVHAQSLESLGRGNYTNGYRIDKLHTFDNLFVKDQGTFRNFKKFNRARITHRIINYSGIIMVAGSIATGSIIALRDDYRSSNISDETVGAVVAVLGIGTSVILYSLASAVVIPIKNKRKRKLLSQYNTRSHSNVNLPELNMVVGVYGVGISYHFSTFIHKIKKVGNRRDTKEVGI